MLGNWSSEAQYNSLFTIIAADFSKTTLRPRDHSHVNKVGCFSDLPLSPKNPVSLTCSSGFAGAEGRSANNCLLDNVNYFNDKKTIGEKKKKSILMHALGFVSTSKKSAQGLRQLIGNYCTDGDTALTRPAFPSQPFLYLTVTAATTPSLWAPLYLSHWYESPHGKEGQWD